MTNIKDDETDNAIFNEEEFVKQLFDMPDADFSKLMEQYGGDLMGALEGTSPEEFQEFSEIFSKKYPDLYSRISDNLLANYPENKILEHFNNLETKNQKKLLLDMEKFLLTIPEEEQMRIGITITDTGRVLFTDDEWKIILGRRKSRYHNFTKEQYLAELKRQMQTAEVARARKELEELCLLLKKKDPYYNAYEEFGKLTSHEIAEIVKVEAEIAEEESSAKDDPFEITY